MKNETTTERQVTAFLQEAARQGAPKLPTAAQVWWRAQILRNLVEKDTQERRATRPALIAQGIALAAWGLTLAWGISAVASGNLGVPSWAVLTMAVTFVPVAGAVALFAFGGEP